MRPTVRSRTGALSAASGLATLALAVALAGTAVRAAAPEGTGARHDLLRYDITITLEPSAQRMDVAGTIHVPAERVRDGILTLATAYFFDGFAPRIAGSDGGPRIAGVTTRDGKWDKLWDLAIAGGPVPADGLTLEIAYSLKDQIKPQFAVRPEGSFAGSSGDAWYPQLDYSIPDTGVITFRVPSGERVIAPGKRISGPGEEAAGTFRFEIEHPAKFAFAAGPYEVRSSADGSFALYTLSEIPDAAAWLSTIGAAQTAMAGYYGPPPYGSLALVEVDFPTIVLGASEQGFILADPSQFKSFDFIYWAHEFAHQYWGGLVRATRNSPAATLLTEGLAEFTALLALEDVEGPAAAKAYRKSGWSAEARGLVPRYFEQVEAGRDLALRDLSPKTGDEILAAHRLSTSKAAFVLSMAADLAGRDAVLEGLRGLLEERRFGFASWAEAEQAIAKAAGEDLEWFFAQWLGRPGAADLAVRWSVSEDKVEGRIQQNGQTYRLPLELELVGKDGDRKTERLWVEGEETAFSFAAPFEVRRIVLDPDYKILRRPRASDLVPESGDEERP